MRRKRPPAVWVTPDLQISRNLITDLVCLHHLKSEIFGQLRVILRLEHISPSFNDGEAVFQCVIHVVEGLVWLHIWEPVIDEVIALLLNVPFVLLCCINRLRTFLNFFCKFSEKFLLF